MSENPKSLLLGGRYDWRAHPSSTLNAHPKDGVSLTATREVEPEKRATQTKPATQFNFKRLNYRIDREKHEVSAYADGRLRHQWVSRDENGYHVPATDPGAWDPVDIAGDDACVFLLDQAYQTIYIHNYGREALSIGFRSSRPGSRWSRIAIDESGCLLVFDAREEDAQVYDRRGAFLGTRKATWPDPVNEGDSASKQPPSEAPSNDPSYVTSGFLLTTSLDSRLYNCSWHRMQMTISRLPPGTRIEVASFAYKEPSEAPEAGNDPRLVLAQTIIAPPQPPPQQNNKTIVEEFLIQSAPGQFLSLAIRILGDGFDTPVIQSLRVHYPRESYLEYLPPLYSANEPMRLFLERFLSIFQTEWDEFDRRIDESEAFFDPDAVPEGTAMNYLASVLGLELEGSWQGTQNRKLLQAVPGINPRRGTLSALRDYVRVYLANFAGLPYEEISRTPFPAFIEGYQERQYLMLSQAGGSSLGTTKPLWSAGVVKRLQLGVFSTEGDVELVSTGDPERDLFHHFAHRFRVYVPASWVRTAEHESLLRRAIEAEMPAHVAYELCLIDAGVQVEVQSIVGLNMIIGDPPPWRLSCEPEEDAPSLPPRNQLNSGAVLSCGGKGPAVLNSGARVGNWILN